MRRLNFIFSFSVIIIVFLLACNKEGENEKALYCQTLKEKGIIDNYEYPVVPGTSEWADFKTGTEKYNACQIPGEVLTNMCTHGLIVTIIDFPLLFDIMAFNIIQHGYDSMKERFNGLQELHRRLDALIEMMEYYEKYDLDNIVEMIEQGDTFGAIELVAKFYISGVILFQNDLINQSDTQIQQELIRIALAKHDEMLSKQTVYWWECFNSNSHIMAEVMLHANFNPFVQAVANNSFLRNTMYLSNDDINEIVTYAELFIN